MKEKEAGLGSRLKETRIKRKYTISKLSEILDISESYLGLLERDQRKPSLSLLTKISVHLGASVDYLLFGFTAESDESLPQITINERVIKDFYPEKGWLDVNKETAFGLSVADALRMYRFGAETLSFLYSAICYLAWRVENSAIQSKPLD